MSRVQCEECLQYSDESEMSQPVICQQCLEKAAAYDVANNDRNYLIRVIGRIVDEFETVSTMEQKLGVMYEAHGRLVIALGYVGSGTNKEKKGEE